MTCSTDYFTVSLKEAELRLDKLLALHFPAHSRTYFQYLIDEGCVLVNGALVKKRERLLEGDEIEVCFLLTPELSLEPEEIPLDILYEDEHLLAINKPAGMVVHPAPGHPSGTFVNALLFHCNSLQGTDPLRPGIVHRLDKETSGVLLAAKTLEAHSKLVALFSERKIDKTYLAICVGTPPEGLISAPIKRHPLERKEMSVCFEGGKEAKTVCKVLAKEEQLSLVELALLTGRTHQLRVHLKHVGTPILGDPVYGSPSANSRFKAERQLLHAHQIRFIHPITQVPLIITAPLPDDIEQFAFGLGAKKLFTVG
ncbi:MAG: RluA family pseudouridine synthase [Verrucomicrobia bacterium]|nr:RluA family pseudouridine synthase [Verrucomicrobiota bacterium]